MTFGAATSVLLTGVCDAFGVRRYKNALTLCPSPTSRGKVGGMSGFSSHGDGNAIGGIGADTVGNGVTVIAWDSERRPTILQE